MPLASSARRGALLLGLLLSAPCRGDEPNPPSTQAILGAWRAAPPLRHARAAHAVVSTDAAIYAIGGTGANDGAPVLEVERFDGKQWSDEATLPGRGLNAPAAVVIDGKIHVIGGFNTITNVPTDKVLIYDPASRKWSRTTPMPAPRGGHGAAVLNGMIHVIGGGNSQSTLADHIAFDPAGASWIGKAPLPRGLGSPAVVAFAGRLYCIGGRSGPRDFAETYIYDPAADAWTAGPPIEARATCGAVAGDGAIYLFGGESQARSTVLADAFRLIDAKGPWTPVAPMPTARSFARAVIFQGSIYVVGGSPTPQRSHAPTGLATVERFDLPRAAAGTSKGK